MYRLCLLLMGLFAGLVSGFGQVVADTLPVTDTARPVVLDTAAYRPADSIIAAAADPMPYFSPRPVLRIPYWEPDRSVPFDGLIRMRHPFHAFSQKAIAVQADVKIFRGKELLFYTLVVLCLLLALIKTFFAKYFSDLLRVFFRTTMKQRQIRDQLMQSPLPSLLYNLFFVLSGGLYIVFMLDHFKVTIAAEDWQTYLYCCVGLVAIYLGKFIGLKLTGWIFNMSQATDSYIFIVFIVNKLIGIFLLPFLFLLAFSQEPVYSVAIILSWTGLGLLYAYRIVLGFGVVRNEVKLNLFHFLVYLAAFEVVPLLLIHKLLTGIF